MVDFIFCYTLFVEASCSIRTAIMLDSVFMKSIVSCVENSLRRAVARLQTGMSVTLDSKA